MIGEVFTIEFIFQGLIYWGVVTSNESEREASFVIRYCVDKAQHFEKTMKLCVVYDAAADKLQWAEVGKPACDPRLIRVIGEALDYRTLP